MRTKEVARISTGPPIRKVLPPRNPDDFNTDSDSDDGHSWERFSAKLRRQKRKTENSSGKPPAKRPRTEPPPLVRHHPRFWFPDGSIILTSSEHLNEDEHKEALEEPNAKFKFKVHLTLLARASGYFAKFAEDFCQDYDACDVDEEGPTEYLEEPTAAVVYLLDAVYDPDTFYDASKIPSGHIPMIVKAAFRLQFPKVFEWSSKLLKNMWPEDPSMVVIDPLPHSLKAIQLARECKIPQILRRALYEVVRSPDLNEALARIRFGEFERSSLNALLSLRQKLARTWIADVQDAPAQLPCDHLRSSDGKVQFLPSNEMFWQERVHGSNLVPRYMYDPVCGIDALFEKLELVKAGFCGECVARFKTWMKEKKEAYWTLVEAGSGSGFTEGTSP